MAILKMKEMVAGVASLDKIGWYWATKICIQNHDYKLLDSCLRADLFRNLKRMTKRIFYETATPELKYDWVQTQEGVFMRTAVDVDALLRKLDDIEGG